ncbi:MAG: hypothetical protein COB09_18925 [Thalassobium sp.]|nr:MAG: hypothetical protein COB09_18925 [Thalassobium sp.]
MTNLKPCPFCGSTDIDPEGVASFKPEFRAREMSWADDDIADYIQHKPACNNCGATTEGDWNTRPECKPSKEDENLYKILKRSFETGELGCHDSYSFFGFVRLADSEIEDAKKFIGGMFKLEGLKNDTE